MINESEKMKMSIELAEKVCEREELIQRKSDFVTHTNKEIKLLDLQIVEIAQELNGNEVPTVAGEV